MNLKKLTALLFAGVTATTPLVTNAQNPTILQGNYISNVFGQANFVLNPNAQTNVANVTLTNATATRSTTTPLVATSEWNVTVTSANGTAAWATRSFDAGMKNQNCEARFSYRGFQATSKAQIKQGANVVAELTLTPSATDPRIASINFPCGDLSSATTFVITDSATLSGTHEIGGIYVGLATNQANVAQAEMVGEFVDAYCSGQANLTTGTLQQFYAPNVAGTCLVGSVQGKASAALSDYNTLKFGFSNLPPGEYMLHLPAYAGGGTGTNVQGDRCDVRIRETTLNITDGYSGGATFSTSTRANSNIATAFKFTNPSTGDRIFQVEGARIFSSSSGCGVGLSGIGSTKNQIKLYRFPSSSELVVTPETQNVWGGVEYTNQNQSLFSGVADPTAFTAYTNSTWNQPTLLKGKAQVSTTNSGNDLGFSIPNLPVGSYKISLSGGINSIAVGTSTAASCNFRIRETTLNEDVVKYAHFDSRDTLNFSTRDLITAANGVFENPSVATRNFILEANKRADTSSGNLGVCEAFSANNPGTTAAGNTKISIILTPIDNASNSALYVQGPVKSASTGTAIPTGYQGEELSGSTISGTGDACAQITVTPGQWILYGTAWKDITSSTGKLSLDVEITTTSGSFPANTGSFQRVFSDSTTTDQLIHTSLIVRTTTTQTYYLNCRLVNITGVNTGTNSNSIFKAVRLN